MKSLAQIIFPSRCIGCSQLGISICSECRKSWHPHFYQQFISVNRKSYPIISAIQYSPIASKVLLSAKEGAIKAADDLLITSICHVLDNFIRRYGKGDLVAIPSRKSATRKRGRNFLAEITGRIATNSELRNLKLLTHIRKVQDQSTLTARERQVNLSGALGTIDIIEQQRIYGNIGPLILVDDLVTTGTTLAEAIRALDTSGFEVLGAVTSCTAQPLR